MKMELFQMKQFAKILSVKTSASTILTVDVRKAMSLMEPIIALVSVGKTNLNSFWSYSFVLQAFKFPVLCQ